MTVTPTTVPDRGTLLMTDGAKVRWDTGYMTCSCPVGQSQRNQSGQSFCRHVEEVIRDKRDQLLAPPDCYSFVVEVPLASKKRIQQTLGKDAGHMTWAIELTKTDDFTLTRQYSAMLQPHMQNIDLGFVHEHNTRMDLRMLAMSYCLDLALEAKCKKCDAGLPENLLARVADGTIIEPNWQLELILIAGYITSHDNLCPEHAAYIPLSPF